MKRPTSLEHVGTGHDATTIVSASVIESLSLLTRRPRPTPLVERRRASLALASVHIYFRNRFKA